MTNLLYHVPNCPIVLTDTPQVIWDWCRTGKYGLVLMVCMQGHVDFTMRNGICMVSTNDLLIFQPDNFINSCEVNDNCQIVGFAFPLKFADLFGALWGCGWHAKDIFMKSHVISLNRGEVHIFSSYYQLLSQMMEMAQGKFWKEQVDSLIKGLLYQLCRIASSCVPLAADVQAFSWKQYHLENFMSLLSASYPKERSVSFYANKLNISAKYLSKLCKELMGRTAIEIINRFVLSDIDALLRNPKLNIKEIVFELNFPNPSFFAKYVKHHFGVSPSTYRNRAILGEIGECLY